MDVLSNRTVEGRKTVTVLFCDLVAYTELAGRLDPEALQHPMLVVFERAAAARAPATARRAAGPWWTRSATDFPETPGGSAH